MGWSKVDITAVDDRPAPEFWTEWAREEGFGDRWHSLGEHLGITGFGVNAGEADAGRELIVPHTETAYGEQEEIYLLVRGRARFTIGGEAVELGPGEVLHATHEVEREAVALEDGTLIVCVGGTPGKPYTPA